MKKCVYFCAIAVLFFGCQKYYISIAQESINKDSLASTQLKTPDPRQKNPPMGEKLIIEWKVPKECLVQEPTLHLHVIYKDYTEEYFVYPIAHRLDYVVYSLVGEQYLCKKGILTYQAQVKTLNDKSILDWKHQLWTKLIILEEEDSSSCAESNSSSVLDQPRQGSVNEVDGQIEEENI
jgi:hypothetical protein